MSATRTIIAGLLSVTLLATSTAPAFARPYGHGGYGRGGYGHGGWRGGHYHHGGSGVVGGLIGGLLIGGAIAVVADSVDNDRQAGSYGYDDTPPPRQPAYQGQVQGYDESDDRRDGSAEDRGTQRIASQGEAVEACSAAAEDESRGGHVNAVTRAQSWSDGWQVEGVVDRGVIGGNGYRQLDRFTCSVRAGQVADVRLGGDAVAYRE